MDIIGVAMKLRKQVYDLLPRNLEEFPVWEYALDEEGEKNQDEATVRPCTAEDLASETARSFIVRARFTLADGTHAEGYITTPPPDDLTLGAIQPVVVTARGQVVFWCGSIAPSAEQLARNYSLLARASSHIFPLTFESAVPLQRGSVRGVIPGFLVLENWMTGKIRIVQ